MDMDRENIMELPVDTKYIFKKKKKKMKVPLLNKTQEVHFAFIL